MASASEKEVKEVKGLVVSSYTSLQFLELEQELKSPRTQTRFLEKVSNSIKLIKQVTEKMRWKEKGL